MQSSGKEEREHTIIDILGRPTVIKSGSWTTSQNAQTILDTMLFPLTIWQTPMWAEKLKGFRFLKATLNFQVQINASPFDTGRLLCFWSPFDQERDNYRPFRTRTNWSGYPGIEIDLGNQMTSELKIPYVSMFSHLDQTKPLQPYGVLRLGIISGFTSANETSVDYTVYCWLTDVELSVPTPYYAQSSEQDHRSNNGVISGGAKVVGDIARLFANTPGIKSFVKPVAWAADAVKGVASALGFSKPVDSQAPMTMVNIPAKNFTNADGLDNSVVLGATHTNEVKHDTTIFGSSSDEMSIPYVVSKFNWIQGFNWTFDSAPKVSPLFTIPVHAGICGTDVIDTFDPPTPDVLGATHMSMVASAFRLWRGGVIFRFSAVKNQYYSGRLIIGYFPGVLPAQIVNYNSFDINKVQKWIWDVRRDTDLQITIPYNSNTQYQRVRMHNNNLPASVATITTDTCTGTLAVFVDNRLRGPPSVASNIWIQVWVKGGSDMTFAIPDMVRYKPLATVPTEALLPSGPEIGDAQMLKVEDTFDINKNNVGRDENEDQSKMLTMAPDYSICNEEFCTGELITNLRVLTRRFGIDFQITDTGTTTFTLDPAYVRGESNPLNYFARLYAFYHGSVRYKVFATSTGSLRAGSTEVISTTPRAYAVNPDFGGFFGRFQHLLFMEMNRFLEITCPYYANVPIQLISNDYTVPNHLRLIYGLLVDQAPAGYVAIMKAAGDDFSYGYLVGPPILEATGAL